MSNRARGIGSKKNSSEWRKEVNSNGRTVYRKNAKPAIPSDYRRKGTSEAKSIHNGLVEEYYSQVPAGQDISGYTKYSNIPTVDSLLISDEKKAELRYSNKVLTEDLNNYLDSADIDIDLKEDLLVALEENPDHPFQAIDEYDYDTTSSVDSNARVRYYGPPLEATAVTVVFEGHPFNKTRTITTVDNPTMASKKYPAVRHVVDTYTIDGDTLTSTRRYDKAGNVVEVRWECFPRESNMEVGIYEDTKYQYDDGLKSGYYKLDIKKYPLIDTDADSTREYEESIKRGERQASRMRSIMNTVEQIRRYDDYDEELPM